MSDISRSADLDATSLERVAGGEDEYGGGGDYTSSSGYGNSTYGSDPTYEESAYAGQSSGYGNSTYGSDPTYEESAYAGQSSGYGNSTFGNDYDQEAGLTRDGMPPVTSTPSPTVTSSITQRFDDGTSLETHQWSTGQTTMRSNEETIQRFDDGSRLITNDYTTRTLGSDLPPHRETNTWSVDSLESRLDNGGFGAFIDHPATASRTDVFTAQDILDNYGDRIPHYAQDGLNDFVNGYYTGSTPPVFDGLPPTPRHSAPSYRGIG